MAPSTRSSSTRKRQKDSLPTELDVLSAGRDMMNRSTKKMGAIASEIRRFRELFGVVPKVALQAFQMMTLAAVLPEGGTLQHWLWTLCFLKVYAKQGPMCVLCGGCDPKTFKDRVWNFLEAFALLEPDVVSKRCFLFAFKPQTKLFFILLLQQIVWENRKNNDIFNDCLVSCDGVDFKIQEYGPAFSSHKFAMKSGLRYEICLGIRTGDLVWVNGPFPCGQYPDISVFRSSLMSHLDEFERVEADDGYIGEHPQYIKCPKGIANLQETKFMQERV